MKQFKWGYKVKKPIKQDVYQKLYYIVTIQKVPTWRLCERLIWLRDGSLKATCNKELAGIGKSGNAKFYFILLASPSRKQREEQEKEVK